MASRASRIAAVAREIFGTLPNRGVRTGMQFLKKPLTGAYERRFYPESIEPYARRVRETSHLCSSTPAGMKSSDWDFITAHNYAPLSFIILTHQLLLAKEILTCNFCLL